MLRGFQRDAAQRGGAEVGHHDLGGFLQVHPPTAHHGAPLAANGFQQLVVLHLGHGAGRQAQLVARFQQRRVVLLQAAQQLQRHQFLIVGIAPHGTAGGQVVAAFGHDDAGPEHAGGVPQVEVIGQCDALLQLGDARLVPRLGLALVAERVDQRGLAHVGHAADQHPHGLGHAAPVGCQQVAGIDELARRGWVRRIQRHGAGFALGVVPVQPKGGALGVGHVLLVQHLEGWLVARKLGQQRIGAGAGQARIQHLDHHINVLDAFGDGFFGQVHVTGEPLDGHAGSFLFVQFRQRRQG